MDYIRDEGVGSIPKGLSSYSASMIIGNITLALVSSEACSISSTTGNSFVRSLLAINLLFLTYIYKKLFSAFH